MAKPRSPASTTSSTIRTINNMKFDLGIDSVDNENDPGFIVRGREQRERAPVLMPLGIAALRTLGWIVRRDRGLLIRAQSYPRMKSAIVRQNTVNRCMSCPGNCRVMSENVSYAEEVRTK